MTVKQATNIKADCDRDALVEAMALITGVVAGRTPTPALQCVRISGQDGRLVLSATDGEVSLTLSVDRVDIEEGGEVLIPAEKLSQIEMAEEILKTRGFYQYRARHHGDLLRIEVEEDAIEKFLNPEFRKPLLEQLKKLGYRHITLDLAGYRTGSTH